MKNIREYLSSVAGLIKAQGRVLSMIITLLLLSSGVWAYDNARIMGSWDDYTEHDVSKEGDTYRVSLPGNTTYYFGVKRNNDWFSCNGCPFTSTSNTNIRLHRNDKVNVPFTTKNAGEYIFTFVKDENPNVIITVTYPESESCTATAPTVKTVEATDIKSTSATLGGTIIYGGTTTECNDAVVTQVFIEWTKTVNHVVAEGSIQATLSGASYSVSTIGQATLEPGNTYYYRAKVINNAGQIGYGEEMSFKAGTETSAPVVRIGKKLTEVTSGVNTGAVKVSGYVAKTGCSNIKSVTVYYANNSAFRNSGTLIATSKTFDLNTPISNNNTLIEDLYLAVADVAQVISKGETLYVRIKATNEANKTSEYSDIVTLTYSYDKFVVLQPFSVAVTACQGAHQFQWTGEGGLFNPAPESWAVKYNDANGNDASSEFTLNGNVMIWNPSNSVESGTYTYYFTASKKNYTSANGKVTLNLTSEKTDVTVTIEQDETEVSNISIEPWTLITLTAVRSDGGTGVEWKASDGILLTTENNGATAYIKGTRASNVAYTVTARAVSESCGDSPESTVKIKVDLLEESCTN